jgi:hypothetical protein
MKFSASCIVAAALMSAITTSALPLNDECVGAKVVPSTSFPYNETVQIANFTYNPRDLNTTCAPKDENGIILADGRTMWWQFTAPANGILTVRAKDLTERFGPALNLAINLFTGSCTNSSLKELKCENKQYSVMESLYKTVSAGVTYFIKVGEGIESIGNDNFDFKVNFEPSNLTVRGDECTDAKVIPHAALPFNAVVDARLYSFNANETINACTEGMDGNSFYYKYTPSSNGLMTIDATGIDADNGDFLDMVIGAFTGSCSTLKPVFCVNQKLEETLYYPVTAGVTYTIKVNEYLYGNNGGRVNFTLSFQRNYFNLINEKDRVNVGVLNDFYNGQYPPNQNKANTINYAVFQKTAFSIEAVVTKPNSVKSVRLTLDNDKKLSFCAKSEKYKIFGEAANDTVPFAIGNRVITATAYDKSNCIGNAIGNVSQPFFCERLQIHPIWLI